MGTLVGEWNVIIKWGRGGRRGERARMWKETILTQLIEYQGVELVLI